MNLNKMMRRYYEQKLSTISDIDLVILPEKMSSVVVNSSSYMKWNNILGWMVTVAMIIHFLFFRSAFDLFRLLPGVNILF